MSAEKESIPCAKIVLLGASGIGAKTSLIVRFVENIFDEQGLATACVSYRRKVVEVDGVKLILQMWGLHQNTHKAEKDV